MFYFVKRLFCFLDEWLFYSTLMYAYSAHYPWWLLLLIITYGSLAITTSYKNIELLLPAQSRHTSEWMFWPFWRSRVHPV